MRRVASVQVIPTDVGRPAWRVRLATTDGHVGHGEAAPHAGFGSGLQATAAALERVSRLIGRTLAQVAEAPELGAAEADFALALAALDADARAMGRPLAALLRADHGASVDSHALVRDAAEAAVALAAGATTLKVKITDRADERLAAIRAAAPWAALRVDANGRWSREQAVAWLERWAALDLEWIEQPCARLADLAWVAARTAVPVAVDEGVGPDPGGALEAAAVMVLKPAFLGPPARALRLAERARARGRRVCVTHALESPIGRAGALHVAAALADGAVHGVGGAGRVAVTGPGTGVTP